MKNISLTLIAAIFLSGLNHTSAQNEGPVESYILALYIQGKKGKPYKASKVVVTVPRTAESYEVPGNGLLYIPDILEDDELYLYDESKLFTVEVNGLDSLNVIFNSPGRIKSVFKNETYNTGYGEVPRGNNTEAYANVDMRYSDTYSTLMEYLRGRVAGVEVVGESIRIRGATSINSSTEPMVIVDGVMMDLKTANMSIAPREIESITVDKTGSMYGVRGANGVIIIKMRSSIGAD